MSSFAKNIEKIDDVIDAADKLFEKIERAANVGDLWLVSEMLEKQRWDAYKMSENLREIKYFLGV